MRHSTASLRRVTFSIRFRLCFKPDKSKVRDFVAHNNAQLLPQITDLVSTSVSELKRSSECNAAEQLSEIKRLKRDTPPSFTKKSNEEQYKANKSVLEAVVDAKYRRKVKQSLDRGISVLKESS